MNTIILNDNRELGAALKILKAQMKKSGLMEELDSRREYKKPSDKRKVKRSRAASQRARDKNAAKKRNRVINKS